MPQNLSTYDDALKDFYGVGLKEATNNSNPVMTEATKNDQDIVGRQAIWSVHTGRSGSTSARGEGGTLRAADRQRFTDMREDLSYLYHTIKVSGQAKHLTKNNEGAFARALETEIDGAEKDLKNDIARQVFGQKVTIDSALRSGCIATLSSDPGTGTTLTMTGASAAEMRYFFIGQYVTVINSSATVYGPYEVTAVSAANKTLTIGSAANAAIASGDFVFLSNTTVSTIADTNYDNEINGLRHLINASDTFAGVTVASAPSWASRTAGSSTTQISETLLDTAVEAVETDGDGSSPSLFIAEHSQRRKLAQQMQAQKTYDGREMTLTAGWRGLQVARGVLVTDRYCPTNDIFAITPKYLSRFVGLDWTWDDDDGKVLYKALDGTDAVEARFKTYMNLVTTVRNAHCRITVSTPSFS